MNGATRLQESSDGDEDEIEEERTHKFDREDKNLNGRRRRRRRRKRIRKKDRRGARERAAGTGETAGRRTRPGRSAGGEIWKDEKEEIARRGG